MEKDILAMFPLEYRYLFLTAKEHGQTLNEIRIRAGQPLVFLEKGEEWYVDFKGQRIFDLESASRLYREDLDKILAHLCNYSIYAYQEEIKQGFLTISGGHRVGIAGQVVMDGGRIRTIKNIHALNIRIAHEKKGVAGDFLPLIYEKGTLKNILIISPPGCGKTTLLRDFIRYISNGNSYGKGMTVGVVDERSEIAGSYMGNPQKDLGIRTDVLDACPKLMGMMLLLRSMSPQVIAIDEIGSVEEIEALKVASLSGVKILATIHGSSKEDVLRKWSIQGLKLEEIFECIFLLSKTKDQYVGRKV